MTDHTAALLPCPFCNAAASVGKIGHDWWRLTIDHADDCALNSDYRLHALQTDKGLGRLAESWNTRAQPQQPAGWRDIDVDALAQEIRRVDGNHSLGAGALAEALMPFLTAAHPSQQEDDVRDAARWRHAVRHWRIDRVQSTTGITMVNSCGIPWDTLAQQADAAMTAQGQEQGGGNG